MSSSQDFIMIPPTSHTDDLSAQAPNPLLAAGGVTLRAKAPTDLWRKPPSTDIANAPKMTMTVPVASFHRARVTVKAAWKRQFDQGGLVLLAPNERVPFPQFPPDRQDWVKTGIEFVDGTPAVSTVAAGEAADWSLVPGRADGGEVTVEIERLETSLWVYLVEGSRRTPIREITWVFQKHAVGDILVGVYAARPTAEKEGEDDPEELVVHFSDLNIT